MFRIVDLFCGCGGMSLGFENAGFEVIAAYDKWEPAIENYRINFNHPIYVKDLNDEDSTDIISRHRPDMIIGGPPCQDFSIAGSRNMGERANLTLKFADIVVNAKPEWFVMENVYNIEKMPVLPKTLKILKDGGYGITTKILDASRCGVPQARKRFFMIGQLGADDGFLDFTLESRLSQKQMTVYDYLGDSLGTTYYYMHPRSYKRRAVFSIYEPSATIRGVNRPIPNGYKCHRGDKAAIEDGVRSLTSKERSYIQTFPKFFKFQGCKTSIEQAIGNAVPVKLAEYVGKCILDYLEEKDEND